MLALAADVRRGTPGPSLDLQLSLGYWISWDGNLSGAQVGHRSV